MKHTSILKHNLMRATMTLALIMACATAWAGTVTVNIIGSGTVNVTYNGTTTEENINSGWNMTLSGSLTLIMIPAQGYTLQELQMVTNLGSSTESTIENNGVYTYTIENVSFYDITYTVVFSIPGVTTYTLTGDGMTFSVEGQTVTSAEEGQRVDITLPSPGNHSYWVVTSSDVAIQKDDANHFHFTMPAKSVIVNAQQYYQTACYVNDESTHGHVMVNGNNAGTENHYADETITLTPVADAGYEYLPGTLTATNINTNESINLTDNGDGTWSFTMPNSQVSVSATFSFDPAHITMSGNEYTIHTATGWNVFCDLLEGGESFNGKTVKLGADITVSRMASTGDPYFRGTFDGQGHTLTLDYGTASNPVDAQFVAPFGEITWSTSPTFRNLNISGHIYEAYTGSEAHNVGGLIGHLFGNVTIEHCTSNVEITSTGGAGGFVGLCEHTVNFNDCLSSTVIHSADGNNSGFVGWSRASNQPYNINFTGCVFNGKLLQINGQGSSNGGFIGWTGASKIVSITNCLYAPAALAEGEAYASYNSATFARGWQEHCSETNSYYTTAFGAAQAKQAHSITAGDFVTVANAGTATAYATSGITSYGTGIKYNNVLYAGSGESVGLTISNTVPASFNFTGYSVTDGASLNGSGNDYTLTMPNAEVDVVITANYTIPSVSYIDENGAAQTCTYYYPLDGTETTLGTAGQETWFVVQGTLNYTHGIQLLGNTHIILCDGAAMNIGSSGSPVSGEFPKNIGFFGGGTYNLSIYAQSGNTGALNIYSSDRSFYVNNLTLAGGNVNATGSYCEVYGDATINNVTASFTFTSNWGFSCYNHFTVHHSSLEIQANGRAVHADNDVTLSYVTANITSSNSVGFYCSNFAVDNSQLTVTALLEAIKASNGIITLGCTAATDFIQATSTNSPTDSYSGTVKIADGQTLYVGSNAYTGTLTDAQRQAIGGRKLTNVAPPTYDYIGLDGQGATHTAEVIDADNMPTSLSGWYIVQDTVNYTSTINLVGETHIILADNAVMNVNVSGNNGIEYESGNNYSLNIYGQSGQSGELNVTSGSNYYAIYIKGGDITIAGGKVTAEGKEGIYAHKPYENGTGGNVTIQNATVTATASYTAIRSNNGDITIDNSNVTATAPDNNGDAIYTDNGNILIRNGGKTTANADNAIHAVMGDITIEGCEVEATGRKCILAEDFTNNSGGNVMIQNATVTATASNDAICSLNGDITINGGQVSATGTNYGIYANSNGNIALGWTSPTDYIYANSYFTNGTLSLTKTFIDEASNTYSGTIAMVNGTYPIDGKTLYPYIPGAIFYLDENGQRRLCAEYTTLNSNMTTLGTEDQETWYVVNDFIKYYEHIEIVGEVHLILKDGAEMNVEPISDNMGISYPDNYGYTDGVHSSFSVYAQSTGADKGQLNVNVDKEYATGISVFEDLTINGGQVTVNANGNYTNGISSNGSLTINGGQVTVNANGNQASYGISSDGSLTINGGQVTNVNGNNIYGINSTESLTINGGQVTANGLWGIYTLYGNVTIEGGQVEITGGEYGIVASNITLSWTNPTDYIYANSYFADGTLTLTKTFKDEDGNTYSGTIAMENETYPIDGKTLYPEGVIMKHITGYGENPENPSDKWVFIASPVAGSLAPSEVHNLLGSYDEDAEKYDYDLYRFNQSADKEWENYNNPAHTAGFKLVNGMGYLYASKEDRTLVFAGEFNTDDSKEVTLQQGWNLVGNPFVETAYIAEGLDFYVMNAEGSEIEVAVRNDIAPTEGIIVYAEDDDDEVTFYTQAPGKGRGQKPEIEQVVLNLSHERGSVIDRAIVRMGGPSSGSGASQTLPKFQINKNSTKIYLPQGGKDYAVACSNGQGEMPVNFRAKENGTYTITVNPEGVEMAYLHLIDNLTGADIDLLSTQNVIAGEDPQSPAYTYTFTAKMTDYESRFKLVFASNNEEGSSTGSETFAFISNGNIIVNGEGVLQVIDVMGRIVFSGDAMNRVSTNGMAPGVYVLRLINGENVKTQKIIVR